MDPATIATTATNLLAPALPYLLSGAEKISESVPAKIGEEGWEKAKQVWRRLHPKVEASPTALEAAKDLASAADHGDYQAALRVQLTEMLAADAELTKDLAGLLEGLQPEVSYQATVQGSDNVNVQGSDNVIVQGKGNTVAGRGGVAIGGNVGGNLSIGGKDDDK